MVVAEDGLADPCAFGDAATWVTLVCSAGIRARSASSVPLRLR
jgi:hypothetical protein